MSIKRPVKIYVYGIVSAFNRNDFTAAFKRFIYGIPKHQNFRVSFSISIVGLEKLEHTAYKSGSYLFRILHLSIRKSCFIPSLCWCVCVYAPVLSFIWLYCLCAVSKSFKRYFLYGYGNQSTWFASVQKGGKNETWLQVNLTHRPSI